MKKVVLLASFAASVLLFAACGSGTTTSSSASSTSSSAVASSTTTETSAATASTDSSEVASSSTEAAVDLPKPGEADLKTAEEASDYLLHQLGYENNEDLYLQEVDNNAEDGNYHFALYSKSIKKDGGSGTVGKYTIAKDGLYSEGDVLGNAN